MARLRDFETKNSLRGFRAVLFRMVSKPYIRMLQSMSCFRAVLFRMVSKLTNAAEKDLFKTGLSELGFEHKQNYQVSGYQRIDPITQEQLNELCGW